MLAQAWLFPGLTFASLCLEDGVPEEQRTYVQDDAGNDISIGLLEGAWAAGNLTTRIAEVLIQEALGFHAKTHSKLGASGLSLIYGVGGCIDFDNPTNQRCGEKETTVDWRL